MHAVFQRFGYHEVQTPTFEELELFTAKSGEGIVKELYDFTDKGDRRMTLRPELTAPAMRFYFADHAFDPKPVKWYYFGNCFRYDRPQAGRYREFWQFGCEIIGAATPLATAELIATAVALLDAVGLKGRDVRVGHVGALRALVGALGLAGEARGAAMRAIDKGDRAGLDGVLDEHGADKDARARLVQALDAASLDVAATAIGNTPEAEELAQVLAHLDDFGVPARLHLGIARGLDYYSGIVFEIHAPALDAQSQLAGGGTYDLAGVFAAQPVATMGFGLGFDRTLVALDAEGAVTPAVAGPSIYFGALGDDARALVAKTVARLRRDGARVDMDLLGRKPGAVAKAANAVGARLLVLVGDRDLAAGRVSVKDLHSGGTTEIVLDGLADWLLEESGGIDLRDYN